MGVEITARAGRDTDAGNWSLVLIRWVRPHNRAVPVGNAFMRQRVEGHFETRPCICDTLEPSTDSCGDGVKLSRASSPILPDYLL